MLTTLGMLVGVVFKLGTADISEVNLSAGHKQSKTLLRPQPALPLLSGLPGGATKFHSSAFQTSFSNHLRVTCHAQVIPAP